MLLKHSKRNETDRTRLDGVIATISLEVVTDLNKISVVGGMYIHIQNKVK